MKPVKLWVLLFACARPATDAATLPQDLRPLDGLGSLVSFLMGVGMEHPDFGHTRARRLQAEWSMSFALP